MLDLGILVIAIIHLILLLFDTTYFKMRPLYFRYAPSLVQVYDPVKGVEPHRFTQNYLAASERYFASCATGTQPVNTDEMVDLSSTMINENPFEQASLTGKLQWIKKQVSDYTGVENSSKQAFARFWQQNCSNIDARQAFFEEEVAPYLRMNYWRQIGFDGQPVDYFILIDLFFILIFLFEFLISWRLAVKRLGSDQRILYPLSHWYDIVSCIPLQQLRILRLLRIFAVYVRLVQSDIIEIQNTWFYKRIIKYQEIIMEEISDRVAVNILTNIQAKTRLGGNNELIKDTLQAYRGEIRDVVVSNVQKAHLPTLQTRQTELISLIADLVMQSVRATHEYQRAISLPLMRPIIESVLNEARVADITSEAMDAFTQALDSKMQSEEMQSLLKDLVDDVLDLVIQTSLDTRIQQLIQDINIKVLEELKESSTQDKIWKAKEQELLFDRIAKRRHEELPDFDHY